MIGIPFSRNPSGMMFLAELDDGEAIDWILRKRMGIGEELGF